MIILKVTKNQGFTLSLEDTFFEKPQEVGQFDSRVFSLIMFGVSVSTNKTRRTLNKCFLFQRLFNKSSINISLEIKELGLSLLLV